jgi:D-beta-D-heptose 7-phosphate kinase/D-beta-D-heptose 1-phosphate adenosyltransferase
MTARVLDSAKAVRAIERFGDLRVLVIGDVMLDIYDFCFERDSKAIDYEMRGKRAYRANESIRVLGGAGNVAANLASLGVGTALIGITGDDGHGVTLRKIAGGYHIEHCLIRDDSRPTTVKVRIYVDDTYLLRRDDEETREISRELALTIAAEALERIESVDAVILSDYDKGLFAHDLARKVIAACTERSVPVVVDFKPANADRFRGATVIAPNEGEADVLLPGFGGADDLRAQMEALHRLLACRSTVVTLGERGVCGIDGGGFFHVPANKVKVVSPVGCGDTVRAVLALGAAEGLSLREACELANDAAATIIQKRATATIAPHEVIDFIRSR